VIGDEVAGVMNDRVRQAFERLRREYLEEMPARLAALESAARSGDHAALRTGLHQLAGSGGSHGFPEISAAARALERELPTAAPGDIAAALATLHDAVTAAQRHVDMTMQRRGAE
jgi:HPt (histidine-containing phosphotransfer) domain-containing protein